MKNYKFQVLKNSQTYVLSDRFKNFINRKISNYKNLTNFKFRKIEKILVLNVTNLKFWKIEKFQILEISQISSFKKLTSFKLLKIYKFRVLKNRQISSFWRIDKF